MKKTTSEQDPRATAHLRELVQHISVAMITTVRPDGALRSRPMITLQVRQEGGELLFLLSDESAKARDLAEEQAVNVSYADPAHDRYVSISGNASILHDKDLVHELWDNKLTRYFPKGVNDPHLALLSVRVETAEYWDAASSRMVSLHGGKRHAADNDEGEHTRVDIRTARSSG